MSGAPSEPPAARPADSASGRSGRSGPIFLERANYRYRRMTDAVRLLPLIGALLWAVPLLWTRGETMSSAALLYVFGIWLVLVVLAGLLARGLGPGGWSDEQTDPRLDDGAAPPQGTATRAAKGKTSGLSTAKTTAKTQPERRG